MAGNTENIGGVELNVNLNTSAYEKGITNLKTRVDKTGKEMSYSFQQYASKIAGMVTAAFSVGAIVNFGKKIIDTTAKFEVYEKTLTTMLGSVSKAKERMAELNKIAAETPFTLEQVVEAGNKLQSLGKYSEENLKMLGDLAAASGKPMEQALNAYSKMVSGQKGIAVDMFKDLLITTDDWVKATGKGVAKSGELLASVEDMAKVLPKILSDKGFAGMMAGQMDTISGKMANFSDNLTNIYANIGSLFKEDTKDVLDMMNKGLASILDNLNKKKDSLKAGVKEILAPINDLSNAVRSFGRDIFNSSAFQDMFEKVKNILLTVEKIIANVGIIGKKMFDGFMPYTAPITKWFSTFYGLIEGALKKFNSFLDEITREEKNKNAFENNNSDFIKSFLSAGSGMGKSKYYNNVDGQYVASENNTKTKNSVAVGSQDVDKINNIKKNANAEELKELRELLKEKFEIQEEYWAKQSQKEREIHASTIKQEEVTGDLYLQTIDERLKELDEIKRKEEELAKLRAKDNSNLQNFSREMTKLNTKESKSVDEITQKVTELKEKLEAKYNLDMENKTYTKEEADTIKKNIVLQIEKYRIILENEKKVEEAKKNADKLEAERQARLEEKAKDQATVGAMYNRQSEKISTEINQPYSFFNAKEIFAKLKNQADNLAESFEKGQISLEDYTKEMETNKGNESAMKTQMAQGVIGIISQMISAIAAGMGESYSRRISKHTEKSEELSAELDNSKDIQQSKELFEAREREIKQTERLEKEQKNAEEGTKAVSNVMQGFAQGGFIGMIIAIIMEIVKAIARYSETLGTVFSYIGELLNIIGQILAPLIDVVLYPLNAILDALMVPLQLLGIVFQAMSTALQPMFDFFKRIKEVLSDFIELFAKGLGVETDSEKEKKEREEAEAKRQAELKAKEEQEAREREEKFQEDLLDYQRKQLDALETVKDNAERVLELQQKLLEMELEKIQRNELMASDTEMYFGVLGSLEKTLNYRQGSFDIDLYKSFVNPDGSVNTDIGEQLLRRLGIEELDANDIYDEEAKSRLQDLISSLISSQEEEEDYRDELTEIEADYNETIAETKEIFHDLNITAEQVGSALYAIVTGAGGDFTKILSDTKAFVNNTYSLISANQSKNNDLINASVQTMLNTINNSSVLFKTNLTMNLESINKSISQISNLGLKIDGLFYGKENSLEGIMLSTKNKVEFAFKSFNISSMVTTADLNKIIKEKCVNSVDIGSIIEANIENRVKLVGSYYPNTVDLSLTGTYTANRNTSVFTGTYTGSFNLSALTASDLFGSTKIDLANIISSNITSGKISLDSAKMTDAINNTTATLKAQEKNTLISSLSDTYKQAFIYWWNSTKPKGSYNGATVWRYDSQNRFIPSDNEMKNNKTSFNRWITSSSGIDYKKTFDSKLSGSSYTYNDLEPSLWDLLMKDTTSTGRDALGGWKQQNTSYKNMYGTFYDSNMIFSNSHSGSFVDKRYGIDNILGLPKTDTIRQLELGEVVLNKQAVQNVGVEALQELNRTGTLKDTGMTNVTINIEARDGFDLYNSIKSSLKQRGIKANF